MVPSDTYTFLTFILSGFFLVWSFRFFAHRKGEISDFKYICFSTFWGLALLATYTSLPNNKVEMLNLLQNPYAAGLALSVMSVIFGTIGGNLWREMLDLYEEFREKYKRLR